MPAISTSGKTDINRGHGPLLQFHFRVVAPGQTTA
jgi:hypothetical protein